MVLGCTHEGERHWQVCTCNGGTKRVPHPTATNSPTLVTVFLQSITPRALVCASQSACKQSQLTNKTTYSVIWQQVTKLSKTLMTINGLFSIKQGHQKKKKFKYKKREKKKIYCLLSYLIGGHQLQQGFYGDKWIVFNQIRQLSKHQNRKKSQTNFFVLFP